MGQINNLLSNAESIIEKFSELLSSIKYTIILLSAFLILLERKKKHLLGAVIILKNRYYLNYLLIY